MPVSPTDDDPLIEELVARYFELRDAGRELSLDEVCSDYPHLREPVEKEIARLQKAERLAVGTATRPRPRREPGGVPGRFEGLEHYRDGGMGRVYLAWDIEAARRVAYKALADHCDTAAGRDKFVREAQLTADLRHAGVVPVFGVVTDACGLPAYAMEFIDGATLDEVVRLAGWPNADRPRAALGKLLDHFLTICGAVAFAHSRRILHNDLKSNNVRVSTAGETFVIDWGLAAAQESAVTPDDAAKDVVRLGGILHEILAGSKPARVTAPDGKVLPWVLEPDAALDATHVPPPLAAVCRKALSSDSAVRYPTVAPLAADVRAWAESRGVSAYPDWWHVRALRWAARHPAATAAIATGLAASVVLGVGGIVATGELKAARIREEANAREATFRRQWMLHNEGVAFFQGAAVCLRTLNSRPDGRALAEARSEWAMSCLETAHREFPDEPAHQYFLALTATQLAYIKAQKGPPADAAEALLLFDRAEHLLFPFEAPQNREGLVAISDRRWPGESTDSALAAARLGRFAALLQFRRLTEGFIEVERANPAVANAKAIPLSAVVQPDPKAIAFVLTRLMQVARGEAETMDPEMWGVFREAALRAAEEEQWTLPWSRGPGADHAKAMRLAGYLAEAKGVSGPAVYNAACVFSLAAAEAGIDPAERQRRGDEAMKYLRRLHDAKYFDNAEKGEKRRKSLWDDLEADLKPLRDRKDFQELCQAVRTKWP